MLMMGMPVVDITIGCHCHIVTFNKLIINVQDIKWCLIFLQQIYVYCDFFPPESLHFLFHLFLFSSSLPLTPRIIFLFKKKNLVQVDLFIFLSLNLEAGAFVL